MASDAAALLKEIQDAQREVDEARKQFALAQEAVEKARNDHAIAEKSKQQFAAEVDSLAAKLDKTLAQTVLSPEFIVELQANIGCYQCYVHVDLTDGTKTPTLHFDAATKEIQMKTHSGQCLFEARLEHAVDIDSSTVRAQKEYIHARIPLTAAAKSNRQASMTAGIAARVVSPSELNVENYSGLQCRECQTLLTGDSNHWERALPLPSSNWLEMVDFWGAAEGAFEYIPRNGIHAAPGRIYVGSADILLHTSNMHMERLTAPKQHADGDACVLACSRCASTMGSRHGDDVRLFKHCIETSSKAFAGYTCDAVLVAQILEVIESDGFFRFEVEAEAGRRLLLQVLSWDATIQTSEFPARQKVLKVMFGEPRESDPALPSRQLRCPAEWIETIYERLEHSSTLLPSAIGGASHLKMGFLFG
ncbi:hypothetical protein AC1031_019652 [Aphanomyces cochlioides]|nr:hypothetical protein AC1031_019652 [Aphanomyces cochlioides]